MPPVSSLSLAQARTYAQGLAATDPVRAQLLQKIADAEKTPGATTVDVGWITGSSASALEGFAQSRKSDGFAPSKAPTGLSTIARGTSPDVSTWLDRAFKSTAKVPTDAAAQPNAIALRRTLLAEGAELLKRPGLSNVDRARIELMQSGLNYDIVKMSALSQKEEPGNAAYAALKSAVALAPSDPVVVRMFAQTTYALRETTSGLVGKVKKHFIESRGHISVETEAREAMAKAAALPDDAGAQVGRKLLAKSLGDKAEQQAADAALAKLPQSEVNAAMTDFLSRKKEGEDQSKSADK